MALNFEVKFMKVDEESLILAEMTSNEPPL